MIKLTRSLRLFSYFLGAQLLVLLLFLFRHMDALELTGVGVCFLVISAALGYWVLRPIESGLQRSSEALSQERAELSVLMSSVLDAIVSVDSGGKPLFYNSRFMLLFGSPRLRAGQAQALGDIFTDSEIVSAFRTAITQAVSSQSSVRLQPTARDGERYFSLSVTPLIHRGGGAYGAVGVFHDVTELKLAEQLRIDFVANVSHELRTPLTAIKGYTDTLVADIRHGQIEAAPQFLEVIERNVERLMSLIEDLLDLSSLESGVELLKAPVQTQDATQRVLHQLEPRRALKEQVIETTFDAKTIHADPRRLEQVLVNLVDNAIKYTPKGGKIQVRWEPGPGRVRLRVIDNGPGVPPESRDRLFERFFRVDKARSREMGGTGLGLAIVKHIVQRHGGTASVKSAVGAGSEFICDFPD